MGLVRAARPARQRGPIAVALSVVLGLALLASLVAAVAGRPSSPAGTVYAVEQVTTGLRQHPRAWIGRTVLVQGRVAGAMSWGQSGHPLTDVLYPPPGLNIRIRLVPIDLQGYPARIWPGPALWVAPHLAPPSLNPPLNALRRIPLVKRLFPAPQPLDTTDTTPRVFRLTLLPRHGTRCPGVCADATLDGVQL